MVPSHFQAILALGNDTLTRYRPSHLRTLISNAAPLDQVTKERVIAYFGDGLLHECYGSTELGDHLEHRSGRPAAQAQCVGLPFLHLGAPATRTATRSAPRRSARCSASLRSCSTATGASPKKAEASMRTVVLARRSRASRPRGLPAHRRPQQRQDHLRRHEHHPPEIEEAIARHPAVREVAMFGVPDKFWGKAINTTIVLVPGATPAPRTSSPCVRNSVGTRFPSRSTSARRCRGTPPGKVLRRELRAPFWAGRERAI